MRTTVIRGLTTLYRNAVLALFGRGRHTNHYAPHPPIRDRSEARPLGRKIPACRSCERFLARARDGARLFRDRLVPGLMPRRSGSRTSGEATNGPTTYAEDRGRFRTFCRTDEAQQYAGFRVDKRIKASRLPSAG